MKQAKIIFAGDLFVSTQYFKNNLISSGVLNIFSKADYRVLNLEAPIIGREKDLQILKTGPHLNIEKNIASNLLHTLNIDLVSLANNHIMDYGERGLFNTIDFCKNEKIGYVGAGKDWINSSFAYSVEINGKSISFLNFAENEWANATNTSPGANPLNIIDNVKKIREEKEKGDIVIVIIHGGNEYHDYPSPRMVKQYRFYAENGASAIIAHHPHCISGYEVHNDVPIFYSLGNFLFTKKSKIDKWYQGLLVELIINKNNTVSYNVIPIEQSKNDFSVRLQDDEQKAKAYDKLKSINKTISSSSDLNEKWNEFVKEKQDSYLLSLSPLNSVNLRILKALIYRLKLYRLFFNTDSYAKILNLIRCEAHRDALTAILKKKLKK